MYSKYLLAALSFSSLSLAAPTPAAAASCSNPTTPSGFVQNGDFENGLSPWTSSVSLGTAQVQVATDGHSLSGCSELSILTTTPGSSSNTQVSISQTLSGLTTGKTYTVTVYQGWPESFSSSNLPTIALATSSGEIAQGYACSGAQCSYEGQGGSVYQKITAPLTAPSPSFQLSVFVTWPGFQNGVPLLLDEISVE